MRPEKAANVGTATQHMEIQCFLLLVTDCLEDTVTTEEVGTDGHPLSRLYVQRASCLSCLSLTSWIHTLLDGRGGSAGFLGR